MHILKSENFKTPFFYRNGHLHTIGSALFRKSVFAFQTRERLELPDGDFLDIDWHRSNSKKCLLLIHGLEGSSRSSYILTSADYFSKLGYDICALNLRSCSGEMNRLPKMYHHGEIEDLHAVLELITSRYNEIYAMGFSLGGNQLLKYLSNHDGIPKNFIKGAAISPPIHLESCVEAIHKPINTLYHKRFLKTLLDKVAEKVKLHPEIDLDNKRFTIKTLREFDTVFTAPLHGFKSGDDYYENAGAVNDLTYLKLPVLLITSKDDPMLGSGCYLKNIVSKNLYYLETEHGGHVGFLNSQSERYLYEEMTEKFFKNRIEV